jgi:SAM-dependent methyltransferase
MQPSDDYRAIHLERGAHYDALLAQVPFDAYMADWERQHLETLIRQVFPGGVDRYLDFACGTGRATATVAPFCRDSLGIDISPTMIQVAGEKVPNARFELCDLTRDDPDIGNFNLVTSFRFFGNAQDDLRESALAALVKRLVPGGHLIINSHRNPRALYAVLDRLTGGDGGGMDLHFGKLRQLLQRHGLTVRTVRPIGAWMVRSRMLNAFRADDPVAVARERRFAHPALAAIAPDTIVVAQRA